MTAYDFLVLDVTARVVIAWSLVAIFCLLASAAVEDRRQRKIDIRKHEQFGTGKAVRL